MTIIKIEGSNIVITHTPEYVNDYYQYIVSLLKYIIEKNKLCVNIILGNINHIFDNKNKNIFININYEHTLVKEGGRDVPNETPKGIVEYGENKYYIRIENIYNFENSNIIIDYSKPNIYNVESSNYFEEFSKKHIYISPSLYEISVSSLNRNIYSLSTFINVNEPRRKRLLEKMNENNMNHKNINNCFQKTDIQALYRSTKIVINIHQTEHHDTFEELRCLPALQNGAIVIAEYSPLHHLIPYKEMIIWTDYDNIISKTKEVLKNYEKYYNSIFTESNIQLLENMDIENKNTLEQKINMVIMENGI